VDGYRFFILLDPALRVAANTSVGEIVDLVVEPTSSKSALASPAHHERRRHR
jgi:hypothetical protein